MNYTPFTTIHSACFIIIHGIHTKIKTAKFRPALRFPRAASSLPALRWTARRSPRPPLSSPGIPKPAPPGTHEKKLVPDLFHIVSPFRMFVFFNLSRVFDIPERRKPHSEVPYLPVDDLPVRPGFKLYHRTARPSHFPQSFMFHGGPPPTACPESAPS